MKNFINIYFIEYAIQSLLRQKMKTLFITVVFTLLVFLLTSVFFITNSIKHELDSTVDSLPQIIVQNVKAGRQYDIDVDSVDAILSINGVDDVISRVWGYYYFSQFKVNFSIVGIDEYELQYKKSLQSIVDKSELYDINETVSMILGSGVHKLMRDSYYKEYFNFIKADGSIKKVYIAGEFVAQTNLESNDMIVVSKETFRDIFDMPQDKATDLVVKVSNIDEVGTIAIKIKQLFPTYSVVTNEDIKVSYQNIFDYKSGLFLALFIIALFTFFIIIYDKASGVSSEEKKEIGILKAIGWRVEDILTEKFYEAFVISFISYLVGVIFALLYVYILQAPLLSGVFVGYTDLKPVFELPFVFDFQTLFLVFLLSVPIYIAATIIPSWKVATLEADEVIR